MAIEPSFSIQLMGPMRIVAASGERLALPNRKTRALLAYLAQNKQPFARLILSDLFCQQSDNPGRTLRWHLSMIRRHLGPQALLTTAEQVQLNTQYVQVDSRTFAAVLSGDPTQWTAPQLMNALEIYQGEFLSGLALPAAPEFELWLLGQRAYLHRLYERGLSHLVGRFIVEQKYETAVHRQIENLLACVQLGLMVGRSPAMQEAWLQAAHTLLAQHPHQRLEALLFLSRASLMVMQGRYETAVTTALAGYELFRHLNEPHRTAGCLVIAAEARLRLSHNRAAQNLFAKAMAPNPTKGWPAVLPATRPAVRRFTNGRWRRRSSTTTAGKKGGWPRPWGVLPWKRVIWPRPKACLNGRSNIARRAARRKTWSATCSGWGGCA
jgi:hypothetical protein